MPAIVTNVILRSSLLFMRITAYSSQIIFGVSFEYFSLNRRFQKNKYNASSQRLWFQCFECGLINSLRPNRDGILFPKLFRSSVRKICSSNREQLLKMEAEGQEFAIFLRSLEQFIYFIHQNIQNSNWKKQLEFKSIRKSQESTCMLFFLIQDKLDQIF